MSAAKILPHGKEINGFRLVFGNFGLFLVLIGMITALPMLIVAFYPEEAAALPFFGFVALFDVAVGLLLFFLLVYRRPRARFVRHQEFLLLMLTWLGAIVSGAAPFFIATFAGKMDMGITKAIFETTSGFSTTGLTVFRDYIDVEGAFCPHVYTFQRALTNFIGGVGLVLLVASVLGTGGGGMSLYVSEGHSDHLLPNIAKSAKLIFGIYSLYTVLSTVALLFAGMPLFDAVTHSMSALSGGGFSCRADNVAAYRVLDGQTLNGAILPVNSLAIEIIIIVSVILSAISFMLHTFLLRGKFKDFFRDDEIRFAITSAALFIIIGFFSALLAINGASGAHYFDSWQEVIRMDFFYVIGAQTNSGFASTTSAFTHHFIEGGPAAFTGHTFIVLIIVIMLIGGGAGSSAGGIKQYRIAIAARSLYYSLRYRFSSIHEYYPKLTYRYGKNRELDEDTIHEAHHYIISFIFLFIALLASVTFVDPSHYNVESAAFDVASAMSNTGLSMVIGPAYVETRTGASYVVMWLLSVGMLLGRLEIFPATYAVSSIGEDIKYRAVERRRKKREALSDLMEE